MLVEKIKNIVGKSILFEHVIARIASQRRDSRVNEGGIIGLYQYTRRTKSLKRVGSGLIKVLQYAQCSQRCTSRSRYLTCKDLAPKLLHLFRGYVLYIVEETRCPVVVRLVISYLFSI